MNMHRKTILNQLFGNIELINWRFKNPSCRKVVTIKNYGKPVIQISFRKHLHLACNLKQNLSISETIEINHKQPQINVNSFTTRTYNCGQLGIENIGENVKLCGWIEFHRVGKFIILRDGYGRTQLLISDENKILQEKMDKTPYESIIEIEGVVQARPPGSETTTMSTGKVEVAVDKIKILNTAKSSLPFNIRDFNKAKEPLRMQYRYLDLRFADMQRNMRMRSRILMDMRDFLVNLAGFVDVETPTLFRATPGGAQEFIVPTRTPGQFYSLVQSPQQFKQILMAGAIDRYFQIARCYRDEGSKPDRQPEFTQLDIEMSFTTLDGVIDLVEKLLIHSWPKDLPPIAAPFERMSYINATEQYGSDKPDISIPNKLIECADLFKIKPDLIKVDDFTARALVFRNSDLPHSLKSTFATLAKNYPETKLVQSKITENWSKSVFKLFGDELPKKCIDALQLDNTCVLFLSFGSKKDTLALLGKIRVDYVNHLETKGFEMRVKNMDKFLWIVDFPLFESGEHGHLMSAHHPFTAPHPDDLDILESDPLKVRALAYDLTFCGSEVGGGSIRIHDADHQKQILDQLRIKTDTMQHLLDALAAGCPPHGGIALGLDRLLAGMLKTKSIRDVIAFPKGLEGRDPLSGAPVEISEQDKKLYHIEIKKT